ncbi:hypothetical protein B0H11DRAFT_2259800 [Mycena galericulata]|nr:hypothetical protein B0H11DRAFT_2259800 [Mycena galericulata]
MPLPRIDPTVASDPCTPPRSVTTSTLASSDNYAANPNIAHKHHWTDWEYGGSVLREREVGIAAPGTPQPHISHLDADRAADVLEPELILRRVTTRLPSRIRPKTRSTLPAIGPANHPVWGPAFAAAVDNIMALIKAKCDKPDNLFDKEWQHSCVAALFAKKTDNADWMLANPEDCREAFAEALKDHDVCRIVVYDEKGLLVPVPDVSKVLQTWGAAGDSLALLFLYRIRPKNEKDSYKLCVMAEIGQIKVLDRLGRTLPRPSLGPQISHLTDAFRPPYAANALPIYYGAVESTTPLAHGGPTPATSIGNASATSLRSPFVTPPRRDQQPSLTPVSGVSSGAHGDVDGPLRVQHSPRPMRLPHVPQVESASMGALAPPNTPVTHGGNAWTENELNNIYAAMAHSYAVKAALHYNHALPGPEPTMPAELLWYLQRSEGTPPTIFPTMGHGSDVPMNIRGTPLLRRVLRFLLPAELRTHRRNRPTRAVTLPRAYARLMSRTASTGYGGFPNEDAIPQHGGNPVELTDGPENGVSAANEIVNLDGHRAADGNDVIATHGLFNADGPAFLHNTGVMLSDTAAPTPYDNPTPRLANDDGVNNRTVGNVEGRWTHGYDEYFGSSEHSSSSSENGSTNMAVHGMDAWGYSSTSDAGSPHETPFQMYVRKQENLKNRKRKEAFQDDDDVARKSKKLFIDSSDEGSNEAASVEGQAS